VTGHSTVSSLFDWVRSHFDNCFPSGLPTHTQGNSRTIIGYVFGHGSLATRLVNGMIRKVPWAYTDHCLLSIDLVPAGVDIGPGCWRFNPALLDDAEFLVLLDKTVVLFDSIVCVDNPGDGGGSEPVPVQDIWESFKVLLKYCAQKYTRGAKARLKNKVASLQQERTILLSTASGIITSDAVLTQSGSGSILVDSSKLKELDQLIDNQIQKETLECMLRSATRWHELGERNNKYFYRVIKERQSKQTIQSLKCSATGSVLVNSDDIIRIPDDVVLAPEDSDSLTDPILMDTLQNLVGPTPLGILNDALIGVFPPSWQQTRMVLLFKKGDPMILKNWRPLSLINSDAKLFTKLLANRLNLVPPQLINPYQTGFMPNRLISDNGWLNQMFMANARDVAPSIPQVAVLLDQEKAYDRVHPDYLRKVLVRFGFPLTLVDCLGTLFFGIEISISINGWLGVPIPQSRGLRQSDPLSPPLFNLAFEPLLRSILSCSGLSGVSLGGGVVSSAVCALVPSVWIDTPNSSDRDFISQSVLTPPSPVKLLINVGKTVLVSLSGVGHAAWVDIVHSEGVEWHDSGSVGAVRYLGYPLYHTSTQLDTFLDDVRLKILRHSNILRQRNLSLRGSGLVANSLLLSRLWHILRVVSVPAKWLNSAQALIRGYLLPFWPRPSMSTMYVPRKFGGVTLVDVHLQQLALQHIYIQRLISGPNTTDFVSPWLVRGIQLYTGKILQKLPPLSLADTWSARWFLDLPLQCVVTVGDAVNTWSPTLIPSVPLRYLVSDIFSWNQATDNLKNTRVVNARKVKEVRRALYPSDGWFAATGFLPTALHNQTNLDVLLPTWLPALYHWTIPQGRGNMVTVSGIRPGDLRWFWHPDRAKFEIRAVIPASLLPKTCSILWVGCFDKWQYWCNVISLLGIGDIFETDFDVWSGLVSLCDLKQKPLSADMLVILGSGFSTLWKYHWRCVIDGDLWNSQAALNMFQQAHSSLIADNLASQSALVVNDSLVMPSG
ncbi:hypothetical protein INT47_002761, partial [Mucor saturninus]